MSDGTKTQGPGLEAGTLELRGIVARVVSGPDRGKEARLDQGTLLLGSQGDLVLTDPMVSRQHAELALMPTGVRVRDLSSKNGTFVGEARIVTVVVPAGSEIRIGDTRIELLPGDAPMRELPSSSVKFGRLVGTSVFARRLFGQLERLAASDVPALLHGEAGTGKSEAARAIHEASARAQGPFVVLPLRGAMRDDVETAFETAHGGTVVLEELDVATPNLQEAIAEALGPVNDPRVLATMREDPRALVEDGRLRRDLWFRLGEERVELAPLAEHTDDLQVLVTALASELGYLDLRVGEVDLPRLRAQRFEDNVRGLRRSIEEALEGAHRLEGESTDPHIAARGVLGDDLAKRPFKEAKESLLEIFERNYVAQLLEQSGGNVSRAAAQAGLDRNHVARLAKKHGLR